MSCLQNAHISKVGGVGQNKQKPHSLTHSNLEGASPPFDLIHEILTVLLLILQSLSLSLTIHCGEAPRSRRNNRKESRNHIRTIVVVVVIVSDRNGQKTGTAKSIYLKYGQ